MERAENGTTAVYIAMYRGYWIQYRFIASLKQYVDFKHSSEHTGKYPLSVWVSHISGFWSVSLRLLSGDLLCGFYRLLIRSQKARRHVHCLTMKIMSYCLLVLNSSGNSLCVFSQYFAKLLSIFLLNNAQTYSLLSSRNIFTKKRNWLFSHSVFWSIILT